MASTKYYVFLYEKHNLNHMFGHQIISGGKIEKKLRQEQNFVISESDQTLHNVVTKYFDDLDRTNSELNIKFAAATTTSNGNSVLRALPYYLMIKARGSKDVQGIFPESLTTDYAGRWEEEQLVERLMAQMGSETEKLTVSSWSREIYPHTRQRREKPSLGQRLKTMFFGDVSIGSIPRYAD